MIITLFNTLSASELFVGLLNTRGGYTQRAQNTRRIWMPTYLVPNERPGNKKRNERCFLAYKRFRDFDLTIVKFNNIPAALHRPKNYPLVSYAVIGSTSVHPVS